MALGIFGAVTFPTGLTVYTLGGEAEAYLGSVTLGGSFAYNWIDNVSVELWSARGWADLYLTPNARIGGDALYLDLDTGESIWGANVDGEVRFAATPVSGWIEGRYRQNDDGDELWAGLIGFRLFMDAPGTTLHEHDKLVPWKNAIIDLSTFN